MPKLKLGTLAAETKAQRRDAVSVGKSDVAGLLSWFRTLRASGEAPKPGGGFEQIGAKDVRAILLGTSIKWSPSEATYIYRGKALTPQLLKAANSAVLAQSSADIGLLATRATNGAIGATELYVGATQALKNGYMASASLAHGGPQNMTPERWGRVSSALLERLEGRPPTDAQRGFPGLRAIITAATKGGYDNDLNAFSSNLVTLSNGGRILYENERRISNSDAGMEQVCRLLAGSVNHCPQCLEVAAQGWRDNDGSDPIGGDYCQDDCYCTEIFRRSPDSRSSDAVEKAIETAQSKFSDLQLIRAGRMKEE